MRVGEKVVGRSEVADYVKVATELGRIPRSRRIALGKRYLEIAKAVADSGEDRHFVTHSPQRSDCTVFLASPLPRERRTERRKYLVSLTALAKSYHQVVRAIGVATEPAGQMGSSYDVAFLEEPPVPDQRAQELGQELFGDSTSRLLDTL